MVARSGVVVKHLQSSVIVNARRGQAGLLALLAASIGWLGGCAVQTSGEFATRDGAPVALLQDNLAFMLVPGTGRVRFEPHALFVSRLDITSGGNSVSLSLPASQLGEQGFHVPAETAGLRGDLDGHWDDKVFQRRVERQTQSCTGPGFCTTQALIVACGPPATACRPTQEPYWGMRPDCPGQQEVENTYEDFSTEFVLELADQPATATPVATYLGRSEPDQRLVASRPLTPCMTF